MTFNPQPKPKRQKGKKCKGSTPETRGYGCGVSTEHRVHGLGKMCGCYSDWLLNSEAGRIKTSKALNKVQAPKIKAKTELEKAKKKSRAMQSLSAAKELTKKVVHEYVRDRDKGKPCPTCGTPWVESFQAGHCYKAELFETIRYHLDNVHGQCYQCNIHYDGRPQEYVLKLPEIIGEERFRELEHLASVDKQKQKVWDVFKLKEIRNQIKFLKNKL